MVKSIDTTVKDAIEIIKNTFSPEQNVECNVMINGVNHIFVESIDAVEVVHMLLAFNENDEIFGDVCSTDKEKSLEYADDYINKTMSDSAMCLSGSDFDRYDESVKRNINMGLNTINVPGGEITVKQLYPSQIENDSEFIDRTTDMFRCMLINVVNHFNASATSYACATVDVLTPMIINAKK